MTALYKSFDVRKFFRILKDDSNSSITIDLMNLSSYRGYKAPVGLVIANGLKGWHDPEKVNNYFKCFGGNQHFYSSQDIKRLRLLWQLRHCIVHTAGTVTIPDSHKVKELKTWGEKNIVFDNNFIHEVVRKFHPLINHSVKRLERNIMPQLKPDIATSILAKVQKLFEVRSKYRSWL